MDSPIIPSFPFPKQPTIIDSSEANSLALSAELSEKQMEASMLRPDINKSERRYHLIKAIVLHWHGEIFDNGYYGPAHEAAKLVKTLAEWGWQTEDHSIMPDDPAEKTANILRGWTRESNFDELLVVYYVGDGSRSSRGPVPQPFRVARRDSSGNFDASIDWPVIHSVLEAAQCDIVMFLNCCHGADAWVSRNLEEDGFKGPPNKVMCIIAATSENETVCMHEQMSFGTLLKNVLDSVRPGLGLKKSISIPMLVKAMKDEIERSKSFRVKDVVHGGMWLMDPCLYEQGDGEYRNILLHRTLGEHDISEIVPLVVIGHTWYQPLLGLAGQYWRLLRVTESELDERH